MSKTEKKRRKQFREWLKHRKPTIEETGLLKSYAMKSIGISKPKIAPIRRRYKPFIDTASIFTTKLKKEYNQLPESIKRMNRSK